MLKFHINHNNLFKLIDELSKISLISNNNIKFFNKILLHNNIKINDAYHILGNRIGIIERINFQNKQQLNFTNKYITDHTSDMITNIIPGNNSNSCIMILSILYMKIVWKMSFLNIKDKKFFNNNGIKKKVHMMRQQNICNYCSTVDFQIIEIPCENNLVFGILLPNKKKNKVIYDPTLYFDQFILTNLVIRMPKFTCHDKMSLKHFLIQNDITEIFNKDKSNFTNLSIDKNLFVSDIIQECVLIVNEIGSLSYVNVKSRKIEKKIIVNHAFQYYVKNSNGLLLLSGICDNL